MMQRYKRLWVCLKLDGVGKVIQEADGEEEALAAGEGASRLNCAQHDQILSIKSEGHSTAPMTESVEGLHGRSSF